MTTIRYRQAVGHVSTSPTQHRMCLTKRRKLDPNLSATPHGVETVDMIEEAVDIAAVPCISTPKEKKIHKHKCTYVGCDHTRRFPKELQDHVDFDHDQKFNNVCDHVDKDGKKCDFKCERPHDLKSHCLHNHAPKDDPLLTKYQCSECTYACPEQSKLDRHCLHNHAPKDDPLLTKYQCSECTYACPEQSKLDRHCLHNHAPKDDPLRTKYQCSECTYACSAQSDLNRHWTAKHATEDDPLRTKYKCQGCGKGFARSDYRDDHFIRHHLPRDDPRRVALYERNNARQNWQYNNDEKFKLFRKLRSRLGKFIKKNGLTKHAGTKLLLGCTAEEAILHLNNNDEGYVFGDEKTFGKLHIDHIRPMASIDPRCKVQVQEVCHFLNTQLLTEADNLAKGANWSPEEYDRTPWGMKIAELAVGWRASGICKCALCV